jgi:hypothetical protein
MKSIGTWCKNKRRTRTGKHIVSSANEQFGLLSLKIDQCDAFDKQVII